MTQLIGKWKHDRSENFEQFLKAIGVGMVARKMAGSSSPTVDITNGDDGTWTIDTNAGLKKTKKTFKIGESYEDSAPDGKTSKFVASMESDVLTVKAVDDSSGPVVTRQIIDGQMVMTLTKGDVTARRFFNKA